MWYEWKGRVKVSAWEVEEIVEMFTEAGNKVTGTWKKPGRYNLGSIECKFTMQYDS